MKRKASYLGNSISDSSWDKIKKRAHDVWDLGTEGERVLALRKKQDTAKISNEESKSETQGLQDSQDHFSDGDLVLLFMGGRQIKAEVIANVDNQLYLMTDIEVITNIPSEWCKRAQAASPAKCRCDCGCKNVADGSLGKCKNCLMVGCG